MISPDLIPWESKEEWLKVYEDAYSGDYQRTQEAVETINQWRYCMRDAFRPGLDFTRAVLKITLNDDAFFNNSGHSLQTDQLQLMYSAEIMRFLNLVTYVDADSKKVSLYGKAKGLNIPDWLVNIRHQMAHGTTLPPLQTLRMAAQFILEWLKIYYWEEEKDGMVELVMEPNSNIKTEYLVMLLRMYVLFREQSILGFRQINDIQDPLIKIQVNSWERLNLNALYTGSDQVKKVLLKLGQSTLDKDVSNVLRAIVFFVKSRDDSLDTIVDFMIHDSVTHSGIRKEVWSVFLRNLHSLYTFPDVILLLYKKCYEGLGEEAYQAGIWTVQLCKALQKRYKVEQMKRFMAEKQPPDNFEQFDLSPLEYKELKKILFKKKLKINSEDDSKIRACIFVRVEEKYPDLRNVLRLRDAIFPEHWELINIIKNMSYNPTEFTDSSILALYDVTKWPVSPKYLNNLFKLHSIYRGEGVTFSKKHRKVYTVNRFLKMMNTYLSEIVD